MCLCSLRLIISSMRYAAPVRKELGVRTVFNILRSSVQLVARQNAASRCLRQNLVTGSGSGSSNLGVVTPQYGYVHGDDLAG